MPDPLPDKVCLSGQEKESQYVHEIYNEIARHFSSTRYKPWPVIEQYIKDQKPGCLGADIGCGNGKYLSVRTQDIWISASDRSPALASICRQRGYECMVADNLYLPYRENAFDFAISIAVIHHFSTIERRQRALREIARVIRPGGTALIFVWALEQQGRRSFDPNCQDYLVPWVLRNTPARAAPEIEAGAQQSTRASSQQIAQDKVLHRYYHLFKKGELADLVKSVVGIEIVKEGYDRDNWYVVVRKTDGVPTV